MFLIFSTIFVSSSIWPFFGQNNFDVLASNPKLATSIDGVSIHTPEVAKYLSSHNYFSDIDYVIVPTGSNVSMRLTVGNREDNIKGVERNNKRYAIHMILCDRTYKSCVFRVNGVPTGMISLYDDSDQTKKKSFNIDANYTLEINSIKFDECDNRRFCNVYYEAYDVVDVRVVGR